MYYGAGITVQGKFRPRIQSNPPKEIRSMTIEALEEPEKPSDHRIWLIRKVIEALLTLGVGVGVFYIRNRFGVG